MFDRLLPTLFPMPCKPTQTMLYFNPLLFLLPFSKCRYVSMLCWEDYYSTCYLNLSRVGTGLEGSAATTTTQQWYAILHNVTHRRRTGGGEG